MTVFIESPIFSSHIYDYLTEEEYVAFQQFLAQHPDAGDVVRGSGGVRKIRWARQGAGKSGGVRILYFAKIGIDRIYLLVIYAKSARESIPGYMLKKIKEAMDDGFDR